MADVSGADDRSLPLSLERRVDEVCLRYEQAWKAGGRPRPEDYQRVAERSSLDAYKEGFRRGEYRLPGRSGATCAASANRPRRRHEARLAGPHTGQAAPSVDAQARSTRRDVMGDEPHDRAHSPPGRRGPTP